jgi:phosphatidylinositol-3-phosphatase
MRLAALVALSLALIAPLRGASASHESVPSFEHVIVVVLENKAQNEVLGNRTAPYFNSLAARYAVLAGYRGVTHPSLPNYLALVSGSTHGIHRDCTTCVVGGRNLADTLERAHFSWKGYAEGLPRAGYTGGSYGRYAKKHMPFLYFRDIVASRARLRRVVPLTQLSRDLTRGRLPSFALVAPNLCHDMHDCSVATGDAWLRRFLPPLLRSPALARSAIFLVTDEPPGLLPPVKPVPALVLGPLVKPGSRYAARTSHYGLLRTVEDAWGLPLLGASAKTGPITGIWK